MDDQNKIDIEALYKEYKADSVERSLKDAATNSHILKGMGVAAGIASPFGLLANHPGGLMVGGVSLLLLGAGKLIDKNQETAARIIRLFTNTRSDFIEMMSQKAGLSSKAFLAEHQKEYTLYELFEKALEKHHDLSAIESKGLKGREAQALRANHEAFELTLSSEQYGFLKKAIQHIKENPDQVFTPHEIYKASIEVAQPNLMSKLKDKLPKFELKESQIEPEDFADQTIRLG